MDAQSLPARLPAEQILAIAGARLAELGGDWQLQPGPLLKGPGTFGVRVGPAHSDSYRHIDLEFLLNVDRADSAIIDCSSGLAADPEEATRQAVAAWVDTTACVALEVAEGRGRLATHFPAGTPGGFPGWHTIVGSIVSWGAAGSSAKQQWFFDTSPWAALAPVITGGLDRDFLNGVRLFVGQSATYQSCEVKINGRLHKESSAALANLDWPRTQQMTAARTFVLLVHPADPQR
jgi:hypothetical protein